MTHEEIPDSIKDGGGWAATVGEVPEVWCRNGYNSVKPFQPGPPPPSTSQDTLWGDFKGHFLVGLCGGEEKLYYSLISPLGQSHLKLLLHTNPKFRGGSDVTKRFDNVLVEEFEKTGWLELKDRNIYHRIVRIERDGEVIYNSNSGKSKKPLR